MHINITSSTIKKTTIVRPIIILNQVAADENFNSFILSDAIDLLAFPVNPTNWTYSVSTSSIPNIV